MARRGGAAAFAVALRHLCVSKLAVFEPRSHALVRREDILGLEHSRCTECGPTLPLAPLGMSLQPPCWASGAVVPTRALPGPSTRPACRARHPWRRCCSTCPPASWWRRCGREPCCWPTTVPWSCCRWPPCRRIRPSAPRHGAVTMSTVTPTGRRSGRCGARCAARPCATERSSFGTPTAAAASCR